MRVTGNASLRSRDSALLTLKRSRAGERRVTLHGRVKMQWGQKGVARARSVFAFGVSAHVLRSRGTQGASSLYAQRGGEGRAWTSTTKDGCVTGRLRVGARPEIRLPPAPADARETQAAEKTAQRQRPRPPLWRSLSLSL